MTISTTTQMIDNISKKKAALVGFGKTVQQQKDAVTSAYQWAVADIVYKEEQLIKLLSDWMHQSELVGEARRIAKTSLCQAVIAWGEKDITCEMNERTVGKKLAGIHIRYITKKEREEKAYQDSVKTLAGAIKKHGNALYDALALIALEREINAGKEHSENIENFVKQLDKTALEAKTAEQENDIAAERQKLIASMLG